MRQYLTFEPDTEGWNNVRMAFEIVVVLAAALNRTLVMAPTSSATPLRHLPSSAIGLGIAELLTIERLAPAVEVISIDEFFRRESGAGGHLHGHGHIPQPANASQLDAIWSWLRQHGYYPQWRPVAHCLVMGEILHPSTASRAEAFCDGRMMVTYNNTLRSKWLLHFPMLEGGQRPNLCPNPARPHRCDKELYRTRLASAYFYSFIFFANPDDDRYYKRMVRDRLQYSAPIARAASAIIAKLDREASRRSNAVAGWSSVHIRRGDFEVTNSRVGSELLATALEPWVADGSMLVVATDVQLSDRAAFFEPLRRRYMLRLIADHTRSLVQQSDGFVEGMEGMVEQLVAARGQTFHGTRASTFSEYIVRLRGYSAHQERSVSRWLPTKDDKGASTGLDREWPRYPFWETAWPIGWEGIDAPDGTPPLHWSIALSTRARQHRNTELARACLRKGLGFAITSKRCIPSGMFHHFSIAIDGILRLGGSNGSSSSGEFSASAAHAQLSGARQHSGAFSSELADATRQYRNIVHRMLSDEHVPTLEPQPADDDQTTPKRLATSCAEVSAFNTSWTPYLWPPGLSVRTRDAAYYLRSPHFEVVHFRDKTQGGAWLYGAPGSGVWFAPGRRVVVPNFVSALLQWTTTSKLARSVQALIDAELLHVKQTGRSTSNRHTPWKSPLYWETWRMELLGNMSWEAVLQRAARGESPYDRLSMSSSMLWPIMNEVGYDGARRAGVTTIIMARQVNNWPPWNLHFYHMTEVLDLRRGLWRAGKDARALQAHLSSEPSAALGEKMCGSQKTCRASSLRRCPAHPAEESCIACDEHMRALCQCAVAASPSLTSPNNDAFRAMECCRRMLGRGNESS